ncbi:MAG: sulfite exporter TauE/SafE family protein [Elusimicrobia bacterium]|nr:sulfite exporter TauE/SafE family protein [Elusimicrobiota bacterium]
MWADFLKLFFTGLTAGAGPCLLSCMPIFLPLLAATADKTAQGIMATIMFAAGRLTAYLILGFLAGWSIRILDKLTGSAAVPVIINIVAAVFIIILGVLITAGRDISLPFCRRFIKYFIDKNYQSMFILGILLGFAPCLPLIGVLTYIAVKASSPWQGLWHAGSFGIGNGLSLLLIGGFSAHILAQGKQKAGPGQKIMIKACGIFLVVWGILLMINK